MGVGEGVVVAVGVGVGGCEVGRGVELASSVISLRVGKGVTMGSTAVGRGAKPNSQAAALNKRKMHRTPRLNIC